MLYGDFVGPFTAGAIGGMAVVMLSFVWVVRIGLWVLEIVGKWFTYKKMGIPGWKCIIPFYNSYVLADKVDGDSLAAWYVVTEAVMVIASAFTNSDPTLESMTTGWEGLVTILGGVAAIAFIVLTCVVFNRVAKGFDHDGGYTVGLVLLPFVFFPILGFGSSEDFDSERIGLASDEADDGHDDDDKAEPAEDAKPSDAHEE